MKLEGIDRETMRYAARRVSDRVTYSLLEESRRLYREHLYQSWTCRWRPNSSLPQEKLLEALAQAEQNAQTHLIKSSPTIRVMRADVLGQDVLIKRYDLNGRLDRIKYRWRASRARRAWAAAVTMRELGLPTPEPLGFLEVKEGRTVVTSYFVTRFLPDAVTTYRWLKVNYRRQNEEWKRGFRTDLLHAILALHEAGIYHADTKLPNLLVRCAGDRSKREFYWTDLECVTAGLKPTRRQIVRNLVQMNGSMRYWVPETDRMKFLHALARTYPWVTGPDIVQKIRRRTRRRLLREVRRHTPPDGFFARHSSPR